MILTVKNVESSLFSWTRDLDITLNKSIMVVSQESSLQMVFMVMDYRTPD